LVLRIMLVGRLNFAEGALFSTRNSWIVSSPGGRMFAPSPSHRIGEGSAIEDEVVGALSNAVRAHLCRLEAGNGYEEVGEVPAIDRQLLDTPAVEHVAEGHLVGHSYGRDVLTDTVTASDDTRMTASAVVDCCTCTVRVASYFCMPGTSTVSRYWPGVTTGNTKNPTSLVAPWR
jgi:hypothetical protein